MITAQNGKATRHSIGMSVAAEIKQTLPITLPVIG
jgi:hypothetical protein